MRIFEDTNFQFIPNRQKGYIFSGILLLLSIISLGTRGLELGIEFRGGMEFVIENVSELPVNDVRAAVGQELGTDPVVKTYGGTGILIRTTASGETNVVQQQIMTAFAQSFPDSNPELVSTNIVGPQFAEDLARGAIYSIFGALFVIFMYILIRFEWRYGLGAVAALIHDVTIVLGLFSILTGFVPFSLQIDQSIIAAFLTIVGYSLNDTVVVFDRVREYTNLFKTEDFDEVVNRSINATLSRTVITSVTTLIVVTILFIFGGEVLRGFSFALIIGVMIGTYSSVFVASPTVVELRHRAEAAKVRS